MAEIFGTAVSALSIGGFAISIAQSALKLKSLLDALKDAPSDILHLIDEIELFSEILSEIERQHRINSAPARDREAPSHNKNLRTYSMDESCKKCLERCQKASEMLLEVADGLKLEAKGGGSGRVKALMEVEKMGKLRQRVEGAWRLLVLAQQLYYSALARQDSMILKRQIQGMEARLEDSMLRRRVANSEANEGAFIELQRSEPHQNPSYTESQQKSLLSPYTEARSSLSSSTPSSDIIDLRHQAYTQTKLVEPQRLTALVSEYASTHIESCLAYAFGSIRYRKFIRRNKATSDENFCDHQEEIYVTDLRLPRWIADIVYETRYQRSRFGWDFNIQTIHLIPTDSPAYDYIESGDIQALKAMLDRRDISPNSHTDTKWHYNSPYARESLLHWAVVHAQVEICQLFLNLGADGIGRHGIYTTPIHISISLISEGGSRPKERREILRMLLDNQEADPQARIAPMDTKFGTPWVFAIGGPTDTLSMINNHIYPPYRKEALAKRIKDILTINLYAPNLVILLNKEELDGAAFEISDERGTTITHSIAYNFGKQLYSEDRAHEDDLEMTKILLHKAANTHSLHAPSGRGSPFSFFLRGMLVGLRYAKTDKGDNSFKPILEFKDPGGGINISSVVQIWAREVLAAGFTAGKLVSHGVKLAEQFLQYSRIQVQRLKSLEGFMEVRLIGFQYGPEVEDWKAWISDPWADMLDDYFADFWDMIENPWENIPGAWFDGTEDLSAKIDRRWLDTFLKNSQRISSVRGVRY